MVLASVYDLIYNVCGMLGALLGPISGLYLVSYLFEHKTEVDMVDMYKEDSGKYYYLKYLLNFYPFIRKPQHNNSRK